MRVRRRWACVSFASAPPTVRLAKAPFGDAVLICDKCNRKLGKDGKAIRRTLKHALKHRAGGKVRLVRAGCFSLCPKRRQVLASARSLGEHRLVVIEPRFSAEAVLDYLLGADAAFPAGAAST